MPLMMPVVTPLEVVVVGRVPRKPATVVIEVVVVTAVKVPPRVVTVATVPM
jgi:hypothetical protein